ncbi:DUF2807 domain-containing protein [Solitalea sp. MAHUQ-68]|uniref:DUF2807 domain-containing protein n=1 Tax=Solitalea agri TaxID=2953739 RepID=A0A9X2EYB9_9SPHI|nr:head GIN domain-containing protein [Solitalea agri]MCO4291254.1 DUF2807 domain-containing protein [Solitalea agri]
MNLFKKSITALVLSIVLVYPVLTYASNFNKHQTEISKDVTENRNVTGFHGIKVSTGINVFITQGTAEKVKVTASDNIIRYLKTEVNGGILEIYLDKSEKSGWSWGMETRNVYITVKDIDAIVASSGSDISSTSRLKLDKLFAQSSSGSDIKLDLDVRELICETSSGSDAEFSGITKSFNVDASSGSDVKAFNLTAEVCVAKASSGSDIDITVTKQLTADASSGGDISYKGKPQKIVKNESSGGDVSAE